MNPLAHTDWELDKRSGHGYGGLLSICSCFPRRFRSCSSPSLNPHSPGSLAANRAASIHASDRAAASCPLQVRWLRIERPRSCPLRWLRIKRPVASRYSQSRLPLASIVCNVDSSPAGVYLRSGAVEPSRCQQPGSWKLRRQGTPRLKRRESRRRSCERHEAEPGAGWTGRNWNLFHYSRLRVRSAAIPQLTPSDRRRFKLL